MLRDLAAKKNLDFRKSFVGRELDVITLQTSDNESTEALSDNYLKVRLAGRHEANELFRVEVTKTSDEGLVAVAQEDNLSRFVPHRFE